MLRLAASMRKTTLNSAACTTVRVHQSKKSRPITQTCLQLQCALPRAHGDPFARIMVVHDAIDARRSDEALVAVEAQQRAGAWLGGGQCCEV